MDVRNVCFQDWMTNENILYLTDDDEYLTQFIVLPS